MSEQSEGVRPSERLEEITCSDEQISDFVRRLGFLDSETEVGEGINKFLHLNQVHCTCSYICVWTCTYIITFAY